MFQEISHHEALLRHWVTWILFICFLDTHVSKLTVNLLPQNTFFGQGIFFLIILFMRLTEQELQLDSVLGTNYSRGDRERHA